jgi:hypothetical protein
MAGNSMTEEQIERAVQRKFDSLDARFMADNSMTQAEYHARAADIFRWADIEYRFRRRET